MMNKRQRELLLETIQVAMNSNDLVFTINNQPIDVTGWGFNVIDNAVQFKAGKPARFDLDLDIEKMK